MRYKTIDNALNQVCRRFINFISSDWFFRITLGLFVAQAILLAAKTRVGLPPDENYHIAYIKLFAGHFPTPFLPPQSSNNVVVEGVRTPFFLYHYLLSIVYYFIKDFSYSVFVLRLLNICMAIGSVFIVKQIADKCGVSQLIRNLSLFLLTNTLMFVFLAASVSYDNLFILFALALSLAVINTWRQLNIKNLLTFLNLILAGCLVKINFIPVAMIAVLLLIFRYRTGLKSSLGVLIKSFKDDRKLNIMLGVCLALLTILFSSRYIVNVAKYHSPTPSCSAVRSIQECEKNTLFNRDQLLSRDKLSPTLNLPHYLLAWGNLMVERTYGIYAHRRFSPNPLIKWAIDIVLLTGLAASVLYWRRLTDLRLIAIITGIYMLTLFLFNYSSYLGTGRISLAIHGRYMFNVLPFFYMTTIGAFMVWIRSIRLQTILIISLITLFLVSNVPTYLIKSTPEWRTGQAIIQSS